MIPSSVARSLRTYRAVVGGWSATERPRTWVDMRFQKQTAGVTLSVAFFVCFMLILAVGTATLVGIRTADVAFEALDAQIEENVDGVQCLRVARRADHVAVFLGVGAPVQQMKLLLRLDQLVADEADAITVFSERLHKSLTMRCQAFDPPRPYEQQCQDIALVYNGTDHQQYVHTRLTFQSDYVESASYNRAALAGLDGMLFLMAGRTYWITSTHMCFSPYQPTTAVSNETLAFASDTFGTRKTTIADLQAFPPTEAVPAATAASDECQNLSYPDGIHLFPKDAANEARTWLVLDSTFLYEYGNKILKARREAVEVGRACASNRTSLTHAHDLYRIDCDVHYPYGWCNHEPSVPLRRLADHKLRIDIDEEGVGVLRAEKTLSLSNIPYLVTYGQGLESAVGRLFIMVLTAAVVFVRGSQNATSSKYMLQHVIDTVRCRASKTEWSICHEMMEIMVDAAITFVALFSRVFVFAFHWDVLVAEGLERVLVFELIGIGCSTLHFSMRYTVLKFDLQREAPLTKLAGPMSIVDVSAAVLLAFSDAPLLSTDSRRFPAVGRLLIGILISISVFSRCAFAAAMCALLASTVKNDAEAYRAMNGYQTVLVVATMLWMGQATASAGSLCALFVHPAAYSISRFMTGDVVVVKFCLFYGLVAACLPTITKIGLRTIQSECEVQDKHYL